MVLAEVYRATIKVIEWLGMKVLFENTRRYTARDIISRNDERAWPRHFHPHIELFVIRKGHYRIEINGSTYDVGDGTVVFFDHYDLHSLEELGSRVDDCIIRISNGDDAEFNKARQNRKVKNPVICNAKLANIILNVADLIDINRDNAYAVSSSIKYILSLIYKHFRFIDSIKGTESEAEYARRIMLYISDHYREKITTSSIAQEMGYSREHISRIFHTYFQGSIQAYVNNKRIEYIEERHRETGKNRTKFVLEAGFGSFSAYYRFLKAKDNTKK